MSFINLLANEPWTDAAINSYVAGIIRSTVSQDDELKAARLSRKPSLSGSEQAFIDKVDEVIAAAVEQGRLARADAALLDSVIAYEAAFDRLTLPPSEMTVVSTDANGVETTTVITDDAERAAAQAVLDNATADIIVLFTQRNPPVPEPVVLPVAPVLDAVPEATL